MGEDLVVRHRCEASAIRKSSTQRELFHANTGRWRDADPQARVLAPSYSILPIEQLPKGKQEAQDWLNGRQVCWETIEESELLRNASTQRP